MNSKQKGCRGERELAQLLQAYGFDARRGQQFKGGVDSPDVVSSDLGKIFHIECKRVEHLNIENAFSQSSNDAAGERVPVVMHRKNRGEWMLTMRLTDWLTIIKDWMVNDNERRDGILSELLGSSKRT